MIKWTKRRENLIYIVILAAVAFIASLPAFRSGVYNGFDLWFHMGRIESIATELSNGQFPVRYETQSWYGNGYISTVMYGNIFLYIPAILHMLGLATYRCYNIYVILTNIIGTCICMYSFTRLFKDKKWGLFATMTYMLAGYYISNIYMRAAAGEYTAMIFLPLVVYGLYRILFEESEFFLVRKILPLVIGVTGLIESHILTTFMTAMMVFIFLIVFIKTTISHIKELLAALVAILGLNAFFLVPFLDSYSSYVFRAGKNTVGINIQKYGLYLDQIFGLFPLGSGGRSEWTSKGGEYTRVGIVHVALFLVMLIAALIYNKHLKSDANKRSFKIVTCVFALGIFSAWISSAYFPWWIFSGDNGVSNIMRGIQYPGRFLTIQTIAWNICGVFALKLLFEKIKEKRRTATFLALMVGTFILALVQTGVFMYTLSCRNLTVQAIEGHDNIADDLYLINGVDYEHVDSKAKALGSDVCKVNDLGYQGVNRLISIDNPSEQEATVLIPIFCYKYIYATDTSGKTYELKPTDTYQYQVTVEPGFSEVLAIGFKEPIMWRISEIVTLFTVFILTFTYIRGRFADK